MFAHSQTIEIQFGDCDPAGIVYFPNYYRFFDNATAGLMSTALGMHKRDWISRYGIAGIPVVHVQTSFQAPARFGDVVDIESAIIVLGRTSFVIRHILKNAGTVSVEGEEKRVWAADEDGVIAARPIPDDVRDALNRS